MISKVTGQTTAFKIGENGRRTQNHNLLEEQPPWEPVLGTENWTIIDVLLEAQCRQLGELETSRGTSQWRSPNFYEFYLLDLCHTEYRRKIPQCFQQGKEEMCHFLICQCILFFLIRSIHRINTLTIVKLAGVLLELN